MELSIIQQTTVFLHSFLLGGLLYIIDLLIETGRCIATPGKYRIIAEDIILVLSAAIANYIFALAYTNGVIRLYSLLAQLFVILLLHLTLGRLLRHIILFIVRAFQRTMLFLRRKLGRFLGKYAFIITNNIRKLFLRKKRYEK